MENIETDLNNIFNKYKRIVGDITDANWSGKSKNNFKTAAEGFISEYKNTLITQIDKFNQAKKLLTTYNEYKKNNNDENNKEAEIANLRKQINNLLNEIISLNLVSTVPLTAIDFRNSIIEKAYNLRDYTKGNNFTYLSTEDATYTFPVYDNKNLKTFSCATFLQQVLLDMGYTQFAGSEKIYAYTKPAYAKYNFEKLGFEVEIITDQTKFQPGDILNAKSAYHTFIVTEVKDNKSVVCMGYPEVRNHPNGRIRTQQELKANGYYAVRVVGIKQ